MPFSSKCIICTRIVTDVVSYRVRKREMANLLATLSVMVALRNEEIDVVVRFLFAFVLNVMIYLVNDCYDVEADLESEARDRDKVLFLKDHIREAGWVIAATFALLLVWAVAYYPGLLVSLAGGAGTCWLYSWRLKRVPFADVACVTFWGVFMPSAGIFLDSLDGWLLVGQLALFSACFETIQTLRDRESDGRAGVRTTAVFLGVRRTMLLLKALICLSALYCILVLHYVFGPFLVVAALIPVPAGGMNEYWNRTRLIFGLAWIGVLVQFYLHGSPRGLICVNF